MQKEVKFALKFDTSDFDRSVEKMQQKLKDIANLGKGPGGPAGGAPGSAGGAPGSGAGDPMMTKPGMESFYKSMQALRTNMHTAMAQHSKEQMKLMKDIAKEEERRGKLLHDQEKISKNKTKDLQEELRIKKELKQTEEQIARLTNDAGRSKTSFDAARGAASGNTQPVFVVNWPGGGGAGGGAGGGGPGPGPGGGGGNKFMTGLGKSLGMAAAFLATGATLIDQYTSLPLTRTGALGSATQSILGSNLQEIASGNVVSSMAWMKEKQKAAEMAQAKFHSQQITAPMFSAAGALSLGASMFTGGGAGGNANANYLMGSVTKAMEKVFDVGGIVPNKISKSLGAASEEYFSTHQAQLMEDFGKNYDSMLEAQKKENPLKNLATNYLQDHYAANLQSQRMMGMTDKGFYGEQGARGNPNSFLEGAQRAGFTGDMAMQMAQAIQGAGGSTRGMRNATLGLKAQRGFDLTNSGSILGAISGGAGSSEASERIFKRILEEGVKNGLDKSESVEELRRFSQTTAEIVAKTGTITGEDTSRIMEGFSRFMNTSGGNTPTIKEEEGAKAAYEQYQQQSGQAGGRFGALQFASMQKVGLGALNPREKGALMQMPEADINSDNDRIIAIAEANGMEPEDLAKKVREAKSNARDTNVQFNPKNREILKNSIGFGKQTAKQLKGTTQEARRAYEEARLATSYQGYTNAQTADAAALGVAWGSVINPETTKSGSGINARLEKSPGTRAGDEITKAAGVAAQAMLENFREFKKEITPAADALDAFTKKAIIFAQVMATTSEKDRAATANYAAQHLFSSMPQQSGKPSPGSGR